MVIGVTGGAGAGKTLVATELERLGAKVIDADVIAREVVEPGGEALIEIEKTFGGEVIDSDGTLK
ncbi:MAG: dephospho-CoA kinase, partial [Deltaproteobacteria bacterium]|nr:dephospho-CoA kinase [Deltaproteobacteria bacterium]